MSTFLTFTVLGLVIGCIYALTATGLVVTYTTSGIFNFAHGAIGMVAAFTYWQFHVAWHWPTLVALVVVLGVVAPAFGIAMERILIRPLFGASVDLVVVVTLGLLLALIGVANLFWPPSEDRVLPQFFNGKSFGLGSIHVTYNQVIVMLAAVSVAVGLRLFFSRTRTGITMRGVVVNPALVAMAGGRPQAIRQLSWAMSTSLAALAGVLIAPINKLNILSLTLFVVNGYAAAMIGRLQNLPMTVVGALGVGLGTSYLVGYTNTTLLREIQQVLPQIVLFVVLILLPQDRLRMGRVSGSSAPQPASLRSSVGWSGVLVVAAILLAPVLKGSDLVNASRAVSLGIILLSLVLLTGYAGMTSLCQMTFAGLGCYAAVHLAPKGSPLGLLVGFLLAAAAGMLVALPTLRLRGLYLALATLTVATAMDQVFFTQVLGTGGSVTIPRIKLPLFRPTDRAYFVFETVVFAVAGIALLAIRRGRIGRRLSALDDSPAACATLGLNITWTKLAVFSFSAGLAGLGGVLYESNIAAASNLEFFYLVSLSLLLTLRIGGITTVTGALLGAVLIAVNKHFEAQHHRLSDYEYLITGVSAIILARYPNGLAGWITLGGSRLRAVFTGRRPGYQPTPLVTGFDATPESEKLAHV